MYLVADPIPHLTSLYQIKRGSKYDGIILDPPAFGRSNKASGTAKNTVWKISINLPQLASNFKKLLSDEAKFVLLTSHDLEWQAEELANLLDISCPKVFLCIYVCISMFVYV